MTPTPFETVLQAYEEFNSQARAVFLPAYENQRASIDKKVAGYITSTFPTLTNHFSQEEIEHFFQMGEPQFTYRKFFASAEELEAYGLEKFIGPHVLIDFGHLPLHAMGQYGMRSMDEGLEVFNDVLKSLIDMPQKGYAEQFAPEVIQIAHDIGTALLIFTDNLMNDLVVGNRGGGYSVLAIRHYNPKTRREELVHPQG